jgi:hypothetical protein
MQSPRAAITLGLRNGFPKAASISGDKEHNLAGRVFRIIRY